MSNTNDPFRPITMRDLEFYAQYTHVLGAYELHAFVRNLAGRTITVLRDPAVTSLPEGSEAGAPLLSLRRDQAMALYSELGRVLGMLDNQALQSALTAKQEHIADLREVIKRVVK